MTVEVKGPNNPAMPIDEKHVQQPESIAVFTNHVEETTSNTDPGNLVYANEEEEPELHFPTYVALASIYLLLAGQGLALQGPASMMAFISADVGNKDVETWIPNALSLVQAVIGPLIASVSDMFQARKFLIVGSCVLSMIGAGIAPGASTIYRVIAAQALLGVGLASVPLSYVVPSEILPRKWRPMAQATAGVAAAVAAVVGPVVAGAMTKSNPIQGWRNLYWILFALWGAAALGIIFGYKPPKRHTRYDHLSFKQKLGFVDLPGMALLTTGLTLFVVGLSVGGTIYPWASVHALAPLIIGFAILGMFGLYEWKGTSIGLLNHDLFRGGKDKGRTFIVCNILMFTEAVLAIPFIVFYSVVTNLLFTTDPLMSAVRLTPFWGFMLLSCPFWGLFSTKMLTIRSPLFWSFMMMTGANIGMATLQPGDSANQIAFAALGGVGFGGPLVLLVTGTQLCVPHRLLATATAVINTTRAIGGSFITAACSTAFTNQLASKLPAYIARAAELAGLPPSSIAEFVGALATNDQAALASVPGVTPDIILSGVAALQQAMADSLRVIFTICAPFGLLACVLCLFLGDVKGTMTYRVDAPVEDLHAKHEHDAPEPTP